MVDDAAGEPSGGSCPPPLREWNATCSISKLPPELISYIIELSLPGTPRIKQRVQVLYATRIVSRAWRNVIDSTPSLWNVVDSNLPLHINFTILQRSGRFPLDVHFLMIGAPRRSAERSEFAVLVTEEIGRWSTAKLWLPFPDVCSSSLTSPAPLLRSLSVDDRHGDNSTTTVALFGGIAPRLEVLKVNGARMDWTASFFRGLRELDLSSMLHNQVSTQQVLEILAITPLLERLRMYDSVLDHHLQPPQRPRPIIRLPNLKTIYLRYTNEEATGAILSSVQAPNCTFLLAQDRGHDRERPGSFPEPALTHFESFLRRTISVNGDSRIGFFDEGMEWESLSRVLEESGFLLRIGYGAEAIGVEWATRIIGTAAEEQMHDLEMIICHERFADHHFAAYQPISRCKSVVNLTVEYSPPFPRPILDLLGNWQDLGDGTKPLPGFPRLEVLVLVSKHASWLDDLEVLVNRRFGGRDGVIGDQVPRLEIVLEMLGSCTGPDAWVDLARLQRLRAANGVRGITGWWDDLPGILAVVYNDDAGP